MLKEILVRFEREHNKVNGAGPKLKVCLVVYRLSFCHEGHRFEPGYRWLQVCFWYEKVGVGMGCCAQPCVAHNTLKKNFLTMV